LKDAANANLRADGPSILMLIQEQLGLKLVAAQGSLRAIVIDRAAAPSEN
jgi:uncharacterized protein (TIGR03435 family)